MLGDWFNIVIIATAFSGFFPPPVALSFVVVGDLDFPCVRVDSLNSFLVHFVRPLAQASHTTSLTLHALEYFSDFGDAAVSLASEAVDYLVVLHACQCGGPRGAVYSKSIWAASMSTDCLQVQPPCGRGRVGVLIGCQGTGTLVSAM